MSFSYESLCVLCINNCKNSFFMEFQWRTHKFFKNTTKKFFDSISESHELRTTTTQQKNLFEEI